MSGGESSWRSVTVITFLPRVAARLTPQTLRHTFGASLLDAGADVALVAVLMGHKWLDTTHQLVADNAATRFGEMEAFRALNDAYC